MTKYKLAYSPEAKESIENLPCNLKNIAERILINISENPFGGTKLIGKLRGLYSARVTRRYRIIYHINTSSNTIFIIDVIHRKESYR
ncbi:MAG: type II toxin-antitoxin system mRNA interferase toxin, RelE/StbE family [Elusimicrobiota bacterium]